MPRPSQIDEQRRRLLPIVSAVFSENGYHKTTTAELARRCDVRENILYRLWADKRAMFLAVIDDMFRRRIEKWNELLQDVSPMDAAEKLIQFEADHLGEFGFYRVVFTALLELEDEEIRDTLAALYRKFHDRIRGLVEAARGEAAESDEGVLPADVAAWTMMGLATMVNIARELKLVPPRRRKALFRAAAGALVAGS